jgi:hypothetical protein
MSTTHQSQLRPAAAMSSAATKSFIIPPNLDPFLPTLLGSVTYSATSFAMRKR